jgi:hypothetical protein
MATVTSAVPQDMLNHIEKAGYQLGWVVEGSVSRSADTKVLRAGEDYDKYFQYSKPGDYQIVPLPERLEFDYFTGHSLEHVIL